MADDEIDYGESYKSGISSSKSEGMNLDKETAIVMNFFDENDIFIRKWSGPMLLGPFVPAMFAILIIVCGNITLETWEGTCEFPLDVFITFAVVLSYIFLLIYTWAVIGDEIYITIPYTTLRFRILRPFRSLKELGLYYILIFLVSFFLWAIGSSFVASAIFCSRTAPDLYQFALFVCVIYWLIFFCVIGYFIKLKYGHLIGELTTSALREKTNLELEEIIFKREFFKIDKSKTYYMQVDDVPLFITNLGIPLPPNEIDNAIKNDFPPDDEGKCDYYKILHWFRSFTAATDADYGGDLDSENEVIEFEDPDAAKKKKKKKGKI